MNYGFALLWLVVLVIAILIEVRTSDVTAVWFMPAAAVALLMNLFVKGEDDFKALLIQIIAFAIISIVSFLIFKISFNKKIKKFKKGNLRFPF